jgi:hypothetical protein
MPRRDVWRVIGQVQSIFVLALAAGLAGLVIPVEVWLGAFVVPSALLLVHALGISSRYWSHAKGGRSAGPVMDAVAAGRPRRGRRSG